MCENTLSLFRTPKSFQQKPCNGKNECKRPHLKLTFICYLVYLVLFWCLAFVSVLSNIEIRV